MANITTKTFVGGKFPQDSVLLAGKIQLRICFQPTYNFLFGRQSVLWTGGNNNASFIYTNAGTTDHYLKYQIGNDVDYILLEGKFGTIFNFGYYTDPTRWVKMRFVYAGGKKQVYVDNLLLFTKDVVSTASLTGNIAFYLSESNSYDFLNCNVRNFVVSSDVTYPVLTTVDTPAVVYKTTDYCNMPVMTQLNKFKVPVFEAPVPRTFAVYDLAYISEGDNDLAKTIALKLAQDFNHAFRPIGHLSDVDDQLANPLSLTNALIELAKDHPEIPCDIGTVWAHFDVTDGHTPYNVATLTDATNPAVLEEDKQIAKYLALLAKNALDPIIPTRIVENGEYLDLATLHVNYTAFVNKMFEGIMEIFPNIKKSQYDLMAADFWTSNRPTFQQLIGISNQRFGTTQVYAETPKTVRMWNGEKRGLGYYFRTKDYEIKAGYPLNTPFVSGGWDKDPKKNLSPAQLLGLYKILYSCGVEYFYASYFSVGGGSHQTADTYISQLVMPAYATAPLAKYHDTIIRQGQLLKGDQLVNWYNNGINIQYEYNFWSGTKEIVTTVRTWCDIYLITTYYMQLNNEEGQPEYRDCYIMLNGVKINLRSRIQGSQYIYNPANPVATRLVQVDTAQQSTHPYYWV